LKFLLLHRNKLSGCIPSSIGKLKKLEYFSARGNDLEGLVPRSLVLGCTGLQELFLYDNPRLQGVEETSEQLLARYGEQLQFRLR
jgi:hypothetical protein